MTVEETYILYDSVNNIINQGKLSGSIITKMKDHTIIFSESAVIKDTHLIIRKGLVIGFEELGLTKKQAFSKSSVFDIDIYSNTIDYCIKVPDKDIEEFDKNRFSDAFPYTITLLHSTGLYLNQGKFQINHLDFFQGEILKNPIALISNGICIADRVVVNQIGDPIFYDTLIIGRDENEELSVSYESILTVDDELLFYIIILGIESIKE